MKERGLQVTRQVAIPVEYNNIRLEVGFRADLIVGGKVIVEVKAQEVVPVVATTILLTYLRFTEMKLGLLINFHVELLKDGIRRFANGMRD